MTNNPGIPTSAILSTPYVYKSKGEFWEFARSRIKYRNDQQHNQFRSIIFPGIKTFSPASFTMDCHRGVTGRMTITAIEISINLDMYPAPYTDLMSYSIQHEIYEMWVVVKPGINFLKLETRHMLAKRYEYRLLVQDNMIVLNARHNHYYRSLEKNLSHNAFDAAIRYKSRVNLNEINK